MPELKRTVADIESVPEGLRSLYVETDGGFTLSSDLRIEGMVPSSEVEGLVRNKEKILAEKKALEDRYSGIDPEKVREWQKELEAKERDQQKLAGDFDARERALTERHAAERAKLEKELKSLRGSLESQMIDSAARTALAKARAKSVGGINLLLPIIKQHVRLLEEDGTHQVVVVGEDGRPRLAAKNGHAAPMTLEQFVSEMRDSDEFSGCFEAENRAGSGATGMGSGGVRAYTREELRSGLWEQAMKEAEERGESSPRIRE